MGAAIDTPGASPEATALNSYILEVVLLSGPLSKGFTQENPVVSRVIRVIGEHTLQQLHEAIFAAFGRSRNHPYEFQFGAQLMDPRGDRYVLPEAFACQANWDAPPIGLVGDTRIASLGLTCGQSFGYRFDFALDWWHQVTVKTIEGLGTSGVTYPEVIEQIGESPPEKPEPAAHSV